MLILIMNSSNHCEQKTSAFLAESKNTNMEVGMSIKKYSFKMEGSEGPRESAGVKSPNTVRQEKKEEKKKWQCWAAVMSERKNAGQVGGKQESGKRDERA